MSLLEMVRMSNEFEEIRANKINDNFLYVNVLGNRSAFIYDLSNSNYYPFLNLEDIPPSISSQFETKELMDSVFNKDHTKIDNIEDYISQEIIREISKSESKPAIYVNQSERQAQLISTKKKIEDYYKIKVNEDNKQEKYYFNYKTNKYELLDTFQLGILLENDFYLTLSERDITTIFGMLRNVEKPNNDAIAFNNVILDTKTFETLPKDTFTVKKIPFDYIPINETKQDTLVEKTLKEILIPANDSTKQDFYLDFLQRFGATFKRVNKHKFIYMLHGKGNDGKGIILKIMSMVHGDLAVSVKPSNLTDDFFATNLSDTNLILIDELNKNSFTNQIVDVLKDVSGRGVRDVRIMRSQETIKAKDYGVIMIATNNIPNVPFNQIAYWKRLIIIELPNTFDETLEHNTEDKIQENILKANEDLEFELQEDTDGIEWLISASIEAYKNKGENFIITQSATATQLLSETINPINAFIDSLVQETANPNNKLTNLEIKYYLLKWCIKNNITLKDLDVISTKELSKEIGRIIANKFPNAIDNKVRKQGITAYPYLILNIDDTIPSIEEIKESIINLEDTIFGNFEY